MATIRPVETGRLILREFSEHDLPAVHAYGSDPKVMAGLLLLPNTEEKSREVVTEFISYQSEEPRTKYELAIELASTGELIGGSGIRMERLLDRSGNREASMGYVLRRESWGNGYATEAASGMLWIGFEMLMAHRVFAMVDTENVSSIRVLEKLGMTREGLHRQSLWSPVHDSWRDVYYYAILEEEWRSALVI